MFRSFTSIALLLVLSMQGQDAAPIAPVASKWSFGVNVSPDLAFRRLDLAQHNAMLESMIDFRNETEMPRFGYSASIMAGYAINARWGFEAGVGYALRGWELDVSKLTFGDQIDERRGFTYSTGELLRNIGWRFHYLDVPVRGTFTLGSGRLRSISSVGISLNLLIIATHSSSLNNDLRITELNAYNTVNLSPTISTGVAYRLNDRMELRMEPTFRYGLLELREAPITEYLWSAGVNFGWFVRL
jgi:hypothetical protein